MRNRVKCSYKKTEFFFLENLRQHCDVDRFGSKSNNLYFQCFM